MTNPECIIEIESLSTRFGNLVVHQDINLCVLRGELLTLIGGSGSGKTTLLRQMLGLEQPSQGSVKIFGSSRKDPGFNRQRKKIRRRSGVLLSLIHI